MEKFKGVLEKIGVYRLTIILICLFALVGLFMPYEKSIGDNREKLVSNPDGYYIKEIDLKNKDAVNISILENFKVYKYAMDNSDGSNWLKGESTLNYVITIVLIVSICLILVATIFKKYILIIIFDIVLAISSLLMNADIVSRGVIPSEKYTYGIAYYLYIIIAIAILVLSIIAIINKRKNNIKGVKKVEKENKNIEAKKNNEKVVVKEEKKTNNVDEKQITIKFNKNTILGISIGVIIILLVVIAVLLFNGNRANTGNNNSGASNTSSTSNNSSIIGGNSNSSEIKGNSFTELKESLEKEEKQVVENLKNELETLKNETDTVEKYKANKDKVKTFYKKIETATESFCKRTKEYTIKYAELIVASGKDTDDMYDDTDNITDDIYDGVLDDLQDDIYDGLLVDMEDYYYVGILDDSDDFKDYSDYYDTSSEAYSMNYDTSSNVYKTIYNTSSDIYKFNYRFASELYGGKLEKAKEKIEDFKADLK